jgi:16S rRNA (uracil1498-N3)-methyltransferase
MNLNDGLYKSPRLYTEDDLKSNAQLLLPQDQVHYLFNVMRRKEGDLLRLFNGRDGEWSARIDSISKKNCVVKLLESIKEQPEQFCEVHLWFTPIKRGRFEFIIEKAVELGVTHLHPVQTDYTNSPRINPVRIEKQILEACEQSERTTVPVLMPLMKLQDKMLTWDQKTPVLAAIERDGAGYSYSLFAQDAGG